MSRAARWKINVTAGKETVKGKVLEVERQKGSWGNADEKDQGLRKAGGPAEGRGAVPGMAQPGIGGREARGREGLWFLIHAGSPGRSWLWGEWNE